YRPVLGAAAVLSLGVLFLYNVVLPPANALLERSMARLAATSIVSVVAPRTFREPRPGVTLFFDRTAPDGRSLEGIFLILRGAAQPDHRRPARRPRPRGRPALAGSVRVDGPRDRPRGHLALPHQPQRVAAAAPGGRVRGHTARPHLRRARPPLAVRRPALAD